MKKKLIIVCVVLGLTQVLIGQVSLTPDMYRERVLAYSQEEIDHLGIIQRIFCQIHALSSLINRFNQTSVYQLIYPGRYNNLSGSQPF